MVVGLGKVFKEISSVGEWAPPRPPSSSATPSPRCVCVRACQCCQRACVCVRVAAASVCASLQLLTRWSLIY